MLVISAFALVIISYVISGSIPRIPDTLDKLVTAPPTTVYDADGRILYTLGGRDIVTLDRISPYFLRAIISVEDKNFYYHHGVDKIALMRSIVLNPLRGKSIGSGASTITQQLTKNLFFSFRKDVSRKLKEMLAAMQIERAFTKEEILEAYCNQISFGSRAYGIERAARTFFGKPASDLTLAESALLAGLPNSPSYLNPFAHPERAKARQELVLAMMQRHGFITGEERTEAVEDSLIYNIPRSLERGGWFVDRVLEKCEELFGHDAVYFGGLKIFTTLDPDMQVAADKAVRETLSQLREDTGRDDVQAALVAVSPLTGAVKAHIGGSDYATAPYDRGMIAKRRPGSGFKPFLYFTALDEFGYTPATVAHDAPVLIKIKGSPDWRVRNFNRIYHGNVILKYAFAQSLNTVAARLVNVVKADKVVSTAKKFGITSPLQPNPSIALGTSRVSPIEMASAYSVVATGGEYFEPYIVNRIESQKGEILYEHFITGKKVADPRSCYLLLDMMKETIETGTAKITRPSGFMLPAAGKTGTTDDYCDSWFTGFTPTLCASAWVGYDREEPLLRTNNVGITGASGGLPIWIAFMKEATKGDPPREFPLPAGIDFVRVEINTGEKGRGYESMETAVPERTHLPDTPVELSGTNGYP